MIKHALHHSQDLSCYILVAGCSRHKKKFQHIVPQRVTAHLDVDAFLGFLSVKQAFDVKVWAPCVLLNRRANPLSFTGDDHVWIDSCGEKCLISALC